jgi:NADPH:quinone reductase-like Zn-dependent oxidoreductase
MKAIVIERFGGPEVMEYRDVPMPRPGPGEVLVEVHAVTVNRTLDIHVREDGDGRRPILPLVLGVDPAGAIVAVGEGVVTSRIGERVAVVSPLRCGRCAPCRAGAVADCIAPVHLGIHRWGGYAEHVVVPSANAQPIPQNLPYPEAAVIFRHFPTGFHLLDCKAELAPGETVLVMGAAGGLGTALVQIAKYRGARVIAAAGSDAGVALARELGAELGVNYRTEDLEARVRAATDGHGVDVVCENIGAADLWPAAFNSLGGGGRLVTAGAHGGGTVTLDVKRLYRRKLKLIGGAGSDPKDLRATFEGAAAGRFRAAIDRVLPLSAVAEAHRLVSERLVTGKVVLVPDAVLAASAEAV